MDKVLIDVALIVALTEVARRAIGISARYVPLVSLVFGVLVTGLSNGWTNDFILMGIILGLTASGAYSSGKAALGK